MNPTPKTVVLEPQTAKVVADWTHTANLLCCRADPTGRFVVAGAIDHTIQRWEMATGKKTPMIGHRTGSAHSASRRTERRSIPAGTMAVCSPGRWVRRSPGLSATSPLTGAGCAALRSAVTAYSSRPAETTDS